VTVRAFLALTKVGCAHALVPDILQGKTTVAEASRSYNLPPSEIEKWIDEGKRGMENALRTSPRDQRRYVANITSPTSLEDNTGET